ncbi:MAG: VanZ family protein [Eubacterium sp.]|nr:VanZ family protein [Eubacterium sp.]
MKFDLFGREFYFLENEYQWQKVAVFFETHFYYSYFNILLLAVILIYCGALLITILRKNIEWKQNLKQKFIWIYLFFVLMFSVFNHSNVDREIRMELDEWLVADFGFHESVILMALINAILYLPIGYMIQCRIKERNKSKAIVYCFCNVLFILVYSLGMEVLQYVFNKGVTSLTDILANLIGGLIGIILAAVNHGFSLNR